MNALAELISRAGRQFRDSLALTSQEGTRTFGEVDAQSNALASALRSLGALTGDRVAILLPNCAAFVIADFALIKAGLIRVPVNVRYAAPEIEFILDHSGAAALITSSAHADLLSGILGKLPALKHVITTDTLPGIDNAVGWQDALARGEPEARATDVDANDGYMLGYTSGTTGRPKGALTTVRARWASLFNTFANETFVSSTDVMLHVTSLAHGSGTKVLPFFVKGGRNVLLSKFTPSGFFQTVQDEQVTTTWLVPTMLAMLVDAADRAAFDRSSLRTIIYGGASIPAPVLAKALAFFGPILVQIYGLTEAPHPDLILPKEDHAVAAADGRSRGAGVPGVTGRVATGVRLRLVDDSGRDVAPGQTGEILVGGDHVMREYWNDPQATADTVRDGWCYTGDLARLDERGLYTIVDRKKEMIISGGYNVYPKEVEDVLYACPLVQECAVIGAPDPLWGEIVHALVVAKAGVRVDVAMIESHCSNALASYKKPRTITLIAELPKTANGKIDKKALRTAYAAPADTREQAPQS